MLSLFQGSNPPTGKCGGGCGDCHQARGCSHPQVILDMQCVPITELPFYPKSQNPVSSVVDRHRCNADPDPDLTFHFDPDLDPDPTPSFIKILLFTAVPIPAYIVLHIFLVSIIGRQNFQYFGEYRVPIFKFLEKVCILTLHLVEMTRIRTAKMMRIRTRIRKHCLYLLYVL
jgi:hypothetical protein